MLYGKVRRKEHIKLEPLAHKKILLHLCMSCTLPVTSLSNNNNLKMLIIYNLIYLAHKEGETEIETSSEASYKLLPQLLTFYALQKLGLPKPRYARK